MCNQDEPTNSTKIGVDYKHGKMHAGMAWHGVQHVRRHSSHDSTVYATVAAPSAGEVRGCCTMCLDEQQPVLVEEEPDAAERGDDGAVVLGGVEREVAREELLQVLRRADAVGHHHLGHALRQLPLRVRRRLHHHQALVQPPPSPPPLPPRGRAQGRRRRHLFLLRGRRLPLLDRDAVVVAPAPAPAPGHRRAHVEPARPGGRRGGCRRGGAGAADATAGRGVVDGGPRDDGPQLELGRPGRRVEAAEPAVARAAVHHVDADVQQGRRRVGGAGEVPVLARAVRAGEVVGRPVGGHGAGRWQRRRALAMRRRVLGGGGGEASAARALLLALAPPPPELLEPLGRRHGVTVDVERR
jgi:hypothetical protein